MRLTPVPTEGPGPGRTSSPPRVSFLSEGASNVVSLRTSATEAVEKAVESLADPFAVPPGACPRCLTPRGAGGACAQCGLDFSLAQPGAFDPPEWLADAWRALLADWASEGRHLELRARVSQAGALSELGRLYRLRLAWFPDDPWAQTAREEILRMATAAVSLRAGDGEGGDGSRGRTLITVVLFLVILALSAVLLKQVLQAMP